MADDFALFDVDGKGHITPGDLDAALKKINKTVSPAYQKEIFDAADKNGDGKVDPSEFKAMMSREGDVTPVDEIVKAFQTLAGGEDKLDMNALRDLMKNWGDKMSDEEIDFMVKDAEGKFLVTDGKLDYKEFASLMCKKP
eukprot:g1021.t1